MKTVAICGFYAKNNFGDDLFNQLLPTFLITRCNLDVTVYSDCHGSIFDRYPVRNALKERIDQEVIVIGGGEVINDSFWMFDCVSRDIDLTRLADKKIILLNVAINETSYGVINEIKEYDILYIVRDKASIEHLKKLNVDLARVHYVPDITIPYFHNVAAPVARQLIINCNYYIFSDLFSNERLKQARAELNMMKLAEFAYKMQNWGWKITMVPAQTSDHVDDRITNSYLAGLLKSNGVKCEIVWSGAVISHLERASLIISSRYHFSAFAIANKIPLIDINFHSKNRNLLMENGLQHCMVDYYDFNCEKLVISAQYSENCEDYGNNCEKLCNESKEACARAFQILLTNF